MRASAAIPILFPPVRVDEPRDARGWYVDGGTRLNTPIKPALDLGAERLVVVATDSVAEPSSRSGRHDMQPPDFGDGALHVLQGMLVDPVVEDMRILGNINMFFAGKNGSSKERRESANRRATDAATERYRAARGKKPYRMIPYIFVAPEKRGAIGRLAREVFKDRYGGWKGLRSVDFPLLNRLLGGESPTHGELLSYLFFDREFIEELIRMGARDARRWLRADPVPTSRGRSSRWTRSRARATATETATVSRRSSRSRRPAQSGRSAKRQPVPATRTAACGAGRPPSSTSAVNPSSLAERAGSSAERCTSPSRAGANSGSNVRSPFSMPRSRPRPRSASTRSSTEVSSPRPTL